MIVVLRPRPTPADVKSVEDKVRELGYEPHTILGEIHTVVAAIGDETTHKSLTVLQNLPMVERVFPVQKRYKLVSREAKDEVTLVTVGNHQVGGGVFHVAAGPCSVESTEQMSSTAKHIRSAGASFLRGGAFKPRSSPYDFQGLGVPGIEILAQAKAETGLPVVSEVVRESDISAMVPVVDILQIGARNALNYSLLEAVAETKVPVLLKRGMASTIEEWLLAAEYLVKNGNPNVILCERGIRTFETATRNTLDLSAVAVAKLECNLPVFVDPSHAAGRADLVATLSCAAIAAGADGIIVEVHPCPEKATSDLTQQLPFREFDNLMKTIRPFVGAAGKVMQGDTKQ